MTFDHRWSILTRIRGGSKGMITMLQTLRETLMLSSKDSLARAFLRLGWAGLGIQIVIGSIPVLVAIYALILAATLAWAHALGPCQLNVSPLLH